MECTTYCIQAEFSKRFTDDSRKVRIAQTHKTIRAGWFAQRDDSHNSMDISCKEAAMLCFFQIKIELLDLPYLPAICVGIASCWCYLGYMHYLLLTIRYNML